MTELIEITQNSINGAEVNSVSARELYKILELGQGQFQRWINKNLADNPFFKNGEDYLGVRLNVEGNDVPDYILSLDVAKHLSMMAKTEVAHKIRNYFIEIEKQASKPMTQIEIIAQTAIALAQQEKKLITIQSDVKEVKTYIDEDIKTRPVSYQQQKALQDVKMAKVYSLGGTDEDLIKKLHSRVWSIFKKRFALPRYAALPASKFEDGLAFINSLTIADMV